MSLATLLFAAAILPMMALVIAGVLFAAERLGRLAEQDRQLRQHPGAPGAVGSSGGGLDLAHV